MELLKLLGVPSWMFLVLYMLWSVRTSFKKEMQGMSDRFATEISSLRNELTSYNSEFHEHRLNTERRLTHVETIIVMYTPDRRSTPRDPSVPPPDYPPG